MRRTSSLSVALALGLVTTFGSASLAGAQGQPATVNLEVQNNSGISGTATLTDLGGGRTRVEVRVDGAGAGPQPAHIHEGTCANLNPAPKFPLTSITNGMSTTEVNASLQQIMSAQHAINLHKSPQEASVYVACGTIMMGGQMGMGGGQMGGQMGGQASSPGTLPRAGDAGVASGMIAGLAGIGTSLVAAGYALRRRARR